MASPILTRRRLLVAGGAGLLLAACGSGDRSENDGGGDGGDDGYLLYKVFSPAQPAARTIRLPLALSAADGTLDLAGPPEFVEVALVDPAGRSTSLGRVRRRAEGIPRGYYPVVTELTSPGRWTLEVAVEGQVLTTTVDALLPSALPAVPGPGDPLPRIPTPTTADPLGVAPICTRGPACPFHVHALDRAIAIGRPVALLVSTPAFCQTAICGPVLELVIDRQERLEAEGFTIVHAEVYTDETARTTTSTVDVLGLQYEPSLFLARAGGVVAERLDYTFDASELDEAINRLVE